MQESREASYYLLLIKPKLFPCLVISFWDIMGGKNGGQCLIFLNGVFLQDSQHAYVFFFWFRGGGGGVQS